MLVEVSKDKYRRHFPVDSNPYISEPFIDLVKSKADRVIRLMNEGCNSIGLIAGIKDNVIRAPFSAPFAGFHYTHEHLLYSEVENFVSNLKTYVTDNNLDGLIITLPPDLYQTNMNAKFINAFYRLGYNMSTPEIINWIDLKKFDGTWVKNTVLQNYNKAINNNLTFHVVSDEQSINYVYDIIFRNREIQGRKIHMSLEDIIKVKSVIPVDFFLVKDIYGRKKGAGVFYRGHDKIAQGIFVGDDMENRSLGIMDLLYSKIYNFYKELDYDVIDLGTSGVEGEPNVGLIRFKEIHNCAASLKFTFSWSSDKN
ncbi:MAG: hypothetical protein KA433_02120 [Fermentimonas sp.]|jgi:hypothetical protein|nr:hypothetical protein [Fermentimonas sp.]MBP6196297.1 hypothetical protein [Fermentimonas sp.]MBP7105473.1 hypothetical protein [Fermentimonas sp.]